MTYSFGYYKQCQYVAIIEMQNVTYRFFEIHSIIEVMTS